MDKLNVKQWRLIKGKTIAEMAAALGVHPNTFRRWENNPEVIPIGAARKIAFELGEDINEVFFLDE